MTERNILNNSESTYGFNKNNLNTRQISMTTEEESEKNYMFSDFSIAGRRLYNIYLSHKRYSEVLFKSLKELGIKKILDPTKSINIETIQCEEPTIVFYPYSISNKICSRSIALSDLIKQVFYDITRYTNEMSRNTVYPLYDENGHRIKVNNVVIGDYYPNRNLILIYANLLFKYPTLSGILAVCKFLKYAFEINNISITNSIDTTSPEYIENMKILATQKFITTIDKEINKKQVDLESNKNEIISSNRKVIASYGNIRRLTSEIFNLSDFKKQFKQKFQQNVDTIKELHFVKDIKYTSEGILVNVGDLTLSHNNITTYIGQMSFLITPTAVKIKNEHPYIGQCSTYEHPHVSKNTPCLADFSPKVNEYLANIELKKLVFLLYRFLKTYTQNSTYISLKKWQDFREKEKKFDSNGEPYKAKKIKKTKTKSVTQNTTRISN